MSIKSKTVLVTLVVCVVTWFMSGCDYFEKTICVDADGQVRGGVVYLPNQEEPFTGKNVCVYKNGQKAKEGNYKDGKKDGKWTNWHENGQKRSEGNYKDGKHDGKWTNWHDNGQKISEGNWKDGKQDGKWTAWNRNGQKQYEVNYKDGVLPPSG